MRALSLFAVLVLVFPFCAGAQGWIEHDISVESWRVAHVVDVDDDGDLDLMGGSSNSSDFGWLENLDGAALSWQFHQIDYDFTFDFFPVDVDADGYLDVVRSGLDVSWFKNVDGTGTSWEEHLIEGISSLYEIDVFDHDNDGDIDVYLTSESNFTYWCEGLDPAGANWNLHYYYPASGWSKCVSDTAYGEGLVVTSSQWTNQLRIHNYNVIDEWTTELKHTDCNADDMKLVDIDGDGDLDVLFSDAGLTWIENRDAESWLSHVIAPSLSNPEGVAAADIDGDGDLDVICVELGTFEINWWENEGGTGTIWSEHVVEDTTYDVIGIEQYDMDGDGDPDLVGWGPGGSWWWENDIVSISPIEVILIPTIDPVIVPQGGSFEYSIFVQSNLEGLNLVDFWTEAVLPNGNTIGPIWLIENFPMFEGATINASGLGQDVPPTAPPGDYVFRLNAGLHPSTVVGQFDLPVEVVAAPGASGDDLEWTGWGYETAFMTSDATKVDASLPVEYALTEAYPNPFNPSTTISVSLPQFADLTVAVFNTLGQQVAELANGRMSAGTHQFTFDGSSLASGIYFVQASVPGELNTVQKIVLMK